MRIECNTSSGASVRWPGYGEPSMYKLKKRNYFDQTLQLRFFSSSGYPIGYSITHDIANRREPLQGFCGLANGVVC